MIRKDVDLNAVRESEPQDRYTKALQMVYRSNIIRLLENVKSDVDRLEMHGVTMLKHKNGGGWVQDSVMVDKHTHIPSSAIIFGNNNLVDAHIHDNTVIGNPYEPISNDKRHLSGKIM